MIVTNRPTLLALDTTLQEYSVDMVHKNISNDLYRIFLDCRDGDVRLVGGSVANEGTVEICFNNLWGTVNEAGWGDDAASILCYQLGFEKEGTRIPSLLYYYYYCNHLQVV